MIEIVIAVVGVIATVVGILYAIFRDKVSPRGRIKQAAEILAALNSAESSNLKDFEKQRWARVKAGLWKEIRKSVKKLDNPKELRKAWIEFVVWVVVTIVFIGGLLWFGIKKGELLSGGVMGPFGVIAGAGVLASMLVTLCLVTWSNVWDIKISNGVLTEEEWEQVVAEMNNRSRGGNTSEGG